jgi:hypothetical protein
LDLFKIKNKICEIRSYIASDWPGVEERKRLYKQLEELEKELKAKEKEEN